MAANLMVGWSDLMAAQILRPTNFISILQFIWHDTSGISACLSQQTCVWQSGDLWQTSGERWLLACGGRKGKSTLHILIGKSNICKDDKCNYRAVTLSAGKVVTCDNLEETGDSLHVLGGVHYHRQGWYQGSLLMSSCMSHQTVVLRCLKVECRLVIV